MDSTNELKPISPRHKYPMWTYNGSVPGPFIRCREGDIVEVRYTNKDKTGIAHNIDFHAVTGPGGGAPCLLAEQDETKTGIFKMMQPGLYIYHCAAAPVPQHIQNGMYGLVLVEPRAGLSKVDKEFYVLQSEFYADESDDDKTILEPSWVKGLKEEDPMYVVFNGREGALTENPLMVDTGDRVRIFVGNGGPNLISSFHIIGAIFDKVYREGDLVSPPARHIQTTLVPAGGAAVVEFDATVPGNYTIVDHSIFRLEKGAVGFIKAKGKQRPDIYDSLERPVPCPGCKLHN
jgi:copper-containing nitrite reductase